MIPARSSSSWQISWLMPQTSVKNVCVYASCIICTVTFLKIFSLEFCMTPVTSKHKRITLAAKMQSRLHYHCAQNPSMGFHLIPLKLVFVMIHKPLHDLSPSPLTSSPTTHRLLPLLQSHWLPTVLKHQEHCCLWISAPVFPLPRVPIS